MHSEFKFASPGVRLCCCVGRGVILAASPLGSCHFHSAIQQGRTCRHVYRSKCWVPEGRCKSMGLRSPEKHWLLVYINPWGRGLAWLAPGCKVVFHLCPPRKGWVSILAVLQNWSHNFSLLLSLKGLHTSFKNFKDLFAFFFSFNFLCECKEDAEGKALSLSTSTHISSPLSVRFHVVD